ncbi:MAG: acyltransferase family protein [Rhizobium sp.]
MSNVKYRGDIDGLRAVAVLSVILYHFQAGIFRGGFVGVDVFFVISGYLITSIISREMLAGQFSFIKFYERRVRRIFPALAFMLVATAIAAFVILYPSELIDYSKSVVSTLTFTSNFYFYSFRGYFLSDVETKPLLHTWSLAVEEQYYIFFPLALLALYRYCPRYVTAAVAVMAILSFGLALWLMQTQQPAAFYFSPPRFWEMLAGSLLALSKIPVFSNRLLREGAGAAGLFLILAAGLLYKPTTAFPGMHALAPVLGATLVIYAGSGPATLVSRLLSLRPLVFVGLLSYSLYLWHWPIAAFYHLLVERPLEPKDMLIVAPVTAILSYISWRFVEQPARDRVAVPARRLWVANFGISALGIVFGLWCIVGSGLPLRFSPDVDRLAAYLQYDDRAAYRRGTCFLDGELQTPAEYDRQDCLRFSDTKPNYVLIGDSHGAHWWSGLSRQLPDVNLMQATSSGCKPLVTGNGLKNCRAFMDGIYDTLGKERPQAVIISARWVETDMPDLLATIDRLKAIGSKVYVLGPIPEYKMGLARLLATQAAWGPRDLAQDRRVGAMKTIDTQFADTLKSKGVTYVSIYDLLCPPGTATCQTTTASGVPMQWDYGHLTAPGSILLAQRLAPELMPH